MQAVGELQTDPGPTLLLVQGQDKAVVMLHSQLTDMFAPKRGQAPSRQAQVGFVNPCRPQCDRQCGVGCILYRGCEELWGEVADTRCCSGHQRRF